MSDSNEREPSAPDASPAPIPGLRTMAGVRWALLIVVALVAIGSWWRFVLSAPDTDGRADRYHCPMHPEIRSPDPGTCPICYMSLEPIPEPHAHAHVADAGAPDAAPEDVSRAAVMLTTERAHRAGIVTVPARALTLRGEERWPAVIEPNEGARAEVRVRADAFVERVTIRQSNVEVRAGQTLAWVYSPEILRAQEELLVAARWRAAGTATPGASAAEAASRERLLLLGVSARDVDAIVASGRARRTLPVRAPIAGHVTRFEAVVGSYVTPATVLYEITDYSRVRILASPLTVDGSWIEPGLLARYAPRGAPERAIDVRLELVEPARADATRALRARFVPVTSEHALRPGEIGEVIVERPPREGVVVPRDAVIDTGTERVVFVERTAGLFEPRAVELGPLYDEERLVTSGLVAGERVVARGAFVLDSESRLQSALAPAPDEARP